MCTVQADDLDYFGKKIDIRILDKLSSKSKLLKLDIGENFSYNPLSSPKYFKPSWWGTLFFCFLNVALSTFCHVVYRYPLSNTRCL